MSCMWRVSVCFGTTEEGSTGEPGDAGPALKKAISPPDHPSSPSPSSAFRYHGLTVLSIAQCTKLSSGWIMTGITASPTAVGLAVIPVIIHPLDNFVHWAMDNTVRPWYLNADDGDGDDG